MQNEMPLSFGTVALDSQKVNNLKKSKPPLGKEQRAYCQEEEYWKTDCPRLKQKKKHNKRRQPLAW